MKKINLTILILLLGLSMSFAQSKKSMDRAAIKSMCGCFEVEFNFAETFSYSDEEAYQPSPNKFSKGLEWAQLVVDEDDQIVIQHLLIAGRGEQKFVIKHWRQDWLYENTAFYSYNGHNEWTYLTKVPAKVQGQWTQKVYQVDDSPRYEGSGSWVHVDGKSYWESVSNAPLPRREYTIRDDYNLTRRGNRHEITDFGWVHEQDNDKIIRKAGQEDVVLAKEKGYNTYTRVPSSRCQAAMDWWKEHDDKWAKVRSKWDELFNRQQDLQLRKRVEEKPLFDYLFALDPETDTEAITEILDKFVVEE